MSNKVYQNICECGGGWNNKYMMRTHYDSCKHQKYEIITYGKVGTIELKYPTKTYDKSCKCGGGWNDGHKQRHIESIRHQKYINKRWN